MNKILMKNTAKITGMFMAIFIFGGLLDQNMANAYYVDSRYDYNQNYYNSYNSRSISANCYVNPVSAPIYSNVTWQVNATGGNGYYTYSWNGTDSLSGSGRIINVAYNNTGRKYASVTITSGNQTIHKTCINYIDILPQNYNTVNSQNYVPVYGNDYYPVNNYSGSYYGTYVYPYGSTYNSYVNSFQVSCYPDKANAEIGDTIRWNSNVMGGNGYYTYSWTGTNGLTSNQSKVITSYASGGTKSATLTVTDSSGQMTTQVCSGSVDIVEAEEVAETVVRTVTVPVVVYTNANMNNQNHEQNLQNQNYSEQSANSLFSLSNVPWGWVVVLIILILMFTVMYLIFNRNKI